MKKLIVHIGAYKTGTSSVQAYLYEQADLLRQHDICYFVSEEMSNRHPDHPGRQTPLFRLTVDELVSVFRSQVLATNIISLEHLWDQTDCQQLLFSAIDKYGQFDQIEVIAYVRRQDDFLQSWYLQELKFGALNVMGLSPMAFAEVCADSVLTVSNALSPYVRKFGERNVRVFVFEIEHLARGDIVADFMTAIGESELMPDVSVRVNPSFNVAQGMIAATLFAVVHKMLGDGGLSVRWFADSLRSIVRPLAEQLGDKLNLDADIIDSGQRKQLVERFLHDNRVVAERFGLPAECRFTSTAEDQTDKPHTAWLKDYLESLPQVSDRSRLARFSGQMCRIARLLTRRR